eukprot:TRINITY_DN12442_c0_g1_i1.p1 TRINITY_DN12442_c0_g1~~TRINITY_DN12442_c0_g1_i1.p1  ORF type:complete len:231 (+),score=30.47 TRINITY_DN12442_c0_g1_i1:81-773(+)
MPPRSALQPILFFGSRLTDGFTQSGYFPPSKIISQRLGVKCVHEGETTFGARRLGLGFRSALQHDKYGAVVILAGTYDISASVPAVSVLASIEALHQQALQAEGMLRSVAVTLPAVRAEALGHQEPNANRLAINRGLEEMCAASHGRIELCDASSFLQNALVAAGAHADGSPLYSDDRHLSADGYAALGVCISQCLQKAEVKDVLVEETPFELPGAWLRESGGSSSHAAE